MSGPHAAAFLRALFRLIKQCLQQSGFHYHTATLHLPFSKKKHFNGHCNYRDEKNFGMKCRKTVDERRAGS